MKKKRLYYLICLLITVMLCMTACSAVQNAAVEKKESKQEKEVLPEYSAAQMYLIYSGRRAEMKDVYTDEIFNIVISDTGERYESAYRNAVKDYIGKIYTMNCMCAEREISLDATQKKKLNNRVNEYMTALEESGNAESVSREEVEGIIKNLYFVELLREDIMSEADVEVSESEARVADIIRIELETSKRAVEVLEEANSGTDFGVLARRNSTNAEINLKVGHGDLAQPLDEAVFAMEDGEISGIIPVSQKFYIIKCVKGYDEEATAIRKEKLSLDRQNKVIGSEYEQYVQSHEYHINDTDWNNAMEMLGVYPDVPDIFEYTM